MKNRTTKGEQALVKTRIDSHWSLLTHTDV